MKKILLVDDEIPILNLFRRVLLDTDYEVFVANSADEAMSVMQQHNIDLVISDMRMPGLDGYHLLKNIKEQYPDTLRVILSGYADEKLVVKALLNNIAKVYLFKPWKNDELVSLINNLFETEEILLGSRLLSIINNAEELPTIQASFTKILALTESDAELADIAQAIAKDQSIASKLLHFANSAFYGLKTGSIVEAVKYLGLKTTRSIVLSTPILNSFELVGMGAKLMQKQWSHAFFTNKIFAFLYDKFLKKRLSEIDATAGLLHNIGVAFLIKHYQAEYLALKKGAGEKEVLAEEERDVLGVAHTELGGHLLRWWDLPYPIIECAMYHHDPFNQRIVNRQLVMAVHIAQKYAFDIIGCKYTNHFDTEVFAALSIDQQTFEEKLHRLEEFKA